MITGRRASRWFWLALALVSLNPIPAYALDPSKYFSQYARTARRTQDGFFKSRPIAVVQVIPPAWYQTKWFPMLWVVTGVVAVWALYRLRMHKVAQSPNASRTATAQENELAQAFRRAIEDCKQQSSIEASLSVIGDAKEMHPVVRDEVCWIGCEAIRNACQHSRGGRLEVVLTYSQDLTLRVADNGLGINRAIVGEGKERHFGLQSILGRAARIGAKLNVASAANVGTEITLLVAGSVAFLKRNKSLSEKIMFILRGVGRTPRP